MTAAASARVPFKQRSRPRPIESPRRRDDRFRRGNRRAHPDRVSVCFTDGFRGHDNDGNDNNNDSSRTRTRAEIDNSVIPHAGIWGGGGGTFVTAVDVYVARGARARQSSPADGRFAALTFAGSRTAVCERLKSKTRRR